MTHKEILHNLKTTDQNEIDALFVRADAVRKECVGDEVYIRGLIEASNICSRNCLYCGIRKNNSRVKRYKLSVEEIFDCALYAKKVGYGTVVIQTGESKAYSTEVLCSIVKKIKHELALAITLSLGELEYDEYKDLKQAGADRYLLRFETSDRELYARLHPDGDYDARFKCLQWLRELGYQVGSGIMIGLPGQTFESVADDILLFDKLKLDMVGAGPYIANPDTPLAGSAGGDVTAALKLIALTRIVTKNAHIPATTALGSIDPLGRQKGLKCGANVIMPNCTPQKYRASYLLYPDKICIDEKPSDCANCIKAMVEQSGRKIAVGPGHSYKNFLTD